MAPGEFVRRYEETGAVTVERNGYRMVLLYQSPEYLAARSLAEGAGIESLDSLSAEYGRAIYVRISLRPVSGGGETGDPVADAMGHQAMLGEKLKEIQGDLSGRLRLIGPHGEEAEPVSTHLQRGLRSGAANTILATFPLEVRGKRVKLDEWELRIDDLGLSLGTVRSKLAPPKGIRLKVAA